MDNVSMLAFENNKSQWGNLVAIEEGLSVPFEIKRVYYIFDVSKDVRRGFHAHRNLEQVLICIHGQVSIFVDDCTEKEIYTLNSPMQGLRISSMVWREMYDFSEDAVLLVLASELYNPSDYIRDYDEYKNFMQNNKINLNAVDA